MLTCPYCQVEVLEEISYCQGCEQQVRCLKCGRDRLGRTKCLLCGNPLETDANPIAPLNTYNFKEVQTSATRYERHVNLSVTDNAMESAAALFGGQLALGQSAARQKSGLGQDKTKALPAPLSQANDAGAQESAIDGEVTEEQDDAPVEQPTTAVNPDALSVASLFFERNNDELAFKVTNFRGKSQRNKQQKFMLMYSWGYQIFFSKPVPSKENFMDALRRAKLYDPHAPTYFDELINKTLMDSGGGFKPNPDGEVEVQSIVIEMQKDDADAEGGKVAPRKKRALLNPVDQKQVEQWVSTSIDIESFDVRTLKNAPQQAMFALGVLKLKLQVIAIKPKMAHVFLLEKYPDMPTVEARLFTHALSAESNKKHFSRNPTTGLYCLSPDAEKAVAQWIGDRQGKGSEAPTADQDAGEHQNQGSTNSEANSAEVNSENGQ